MTFEFDCPSCDKRLRIAEQAAGKRIRCPNCGAISPPRNDSPVTSTRWSMKTSDGHIYGPVAKSELDSWVRQGRVDPRYKILREGSDSWLWAEDVYPQLAPEAENPIAQSGRIASPYANRPSPARHQRPSSARHWHSSVSIGRPPTDRRSPCDRMTAGLLGLILGPLGVHRWYMGSPAIGILQVAVTICTMGFGALWGIMEGILILIGIITRDADGAVMR